MRGIFHSESLGDLPHLNLNPTLLLDRIERFPLRGPFPGRPPGPTGKDLAAARRMGASAPDLFLCQTRRTERTMSRTALIALTTLRIAGLAAALGSSFILPSSPTSDAPSASTASTCQAASVPLGEAATLCLISVGSLVLLIGRRIVRARSASDGSREPQATDKA